MSKGTKLEFTPDWSVAPGETLKETMDAKGLTVESVEQQTGLDVGGLLRGETFLTSLIAEKLEEVTEVPAEFWLRLEARYRRRSMKSCLERLNQLEQLYPNLAGALERARKALQAHQPDTPYLINWTDESILFEFDPNDYGGTRNLIEFYADDPIIWLSKDVNGIRNFKELTFEELSTVWPKREQ